MRGMVNAGVSLAGILPQSTYKPLCRVEKLGRTAITEGEAKRPIRIAFFNNMEADAIDQVCDTLNDLLNKSEIKSGTPA